MKKLSESFPMSQLKTTLKRCGSPLLSLEVCSRAPTSNYYGEIKD